MIRAYVGMLCVLWLAGSLGAQDPPTQSGSQPSPLVDGLLELLDDPKSNARLDQGSAEGDRQGITPADVGLGGENLRERSANPLESVRQSMFIAAGFLQRGRNDPETRRLQSDIVQRLDDLIAQIEQSESKGTAQSRPAEQQDRSQSQQEQQEQSGRKQAASSQQTPQGDDQDTPSDESSTSGNEGSTGQPGSAENALVDLADPKALQRNVWGQLPERMRKQMQSRMVEQFLPSYREQIEAYFEALLRK